MYDIQIAENLERLKKKYYYDLQIYDKLCALGYLLRKNIIPDDLIVLYSNDIQILEQNLIHLA